MISLLLWETQFHLTFCKFLPPLIIYVRRVRCEVGGDPSRSKPLISGVGPHLCTIFAEFANILPPGTLAGGNTGHNIIVSIKLARISSNLLKTYLFIYVISNYSSSVWLGLSEPAGSTKHSEHKIVSWTSSLDLSDILSLLFNILMLLVIPVVFLSMVISLASSLRQTTSGSGLPWVAHSRVTLLPSVWTMSELLRLSTILGGTDGTENN